MRKVGLIEADTERFTVARRRSGKGWRFIDLDSGRSPGREMSGVLRGLAIPPAWKQVRCASDPRSHILAVGTDPGGRRQYIYNPDWEKVRTAIKERRLLRFGNALPSIRERVARDLAKAREGSLTRERVTAAAVRLLDRAGMRPGNEAYAIAGNRGAATLRRSDVRVNGARMSLDYVGKSGVEHAFTVRDAAAARVMRRLKRMRARPHRRKRERLFLYRGEDGRSYPLTAAKLNRYLAEAAGAPVSAKDFRTFIGSAVALEALFESRDAKCERERKRAVTDAIEATSDRLRNTPAVARSSYIAPTILGAFDEGTLSDTLFRGPTRNGLDRAETALMRHLERHADA